MNGNNLKNTYLEINKDTKEYVRKVYNLDKEDRLKESVDLLQDWIEKQEHFARKDFDRIYLEHMLMGSKGSVERTKERLDRVCTYKTLMPQFFEDVNVNDLTHHKRMFMGPLPKLTKDHVRIFVSRNVGKDFCPQNFTDLYKFVMMEAEFMRTYDYAFAYEIVLDYRHCSFTDLITNFSVLECRNMALILVEGYGVRVKGIHLIIDSRFLDIMMTLAKQIIPAKLRDRIHLHRNVDSLHEKVDKDMLPVELGGNGTSMVALYERLKNIIASEGFREYWRRMIQYRTDETLRPKNKFNEHYLGTPGSFRTFSVD